MKNHEVPAPSANVPKRTKKGFTLIELVIAGVILVVLGIAVVNSVLARQDQTQIGAARNLITVDIPQALASIYNNQGRTYINLTTANGPGFIAQAGAAATMPWGDAWTVQTAGTAGPNSTIQLRFPTTNARNPGQMVTNLTAAGVLTGTSTMITAAASTVANMVDVTYSRPQ